MLKLLIAALLPLSLGTPTNAGPAAGFSSKALIELKKAAPRQAALEFPATDTEEQPLNAVPQKAVHPSVHCYGLAREKLSATVWGAVMLCSGTPSAQAPVSCYTEARSRLTSLGSVLLCTGTANPTAPAECYDKALMLNLTALGAATLCHAADNAEARIACYTEARKYLNPTGSVELCGRLPFELYDQIYGKDDRRDGNSGNGSPSSGESPKGEELPGKGRFLESGK